MMSEWMAVVLFLVAAAACVFDVRENRLPNVLTLSALVLAFVLRAPGGWDAIGSGLAGAGIGFLLALPLFLLGGAGGGDLKLLTAMGAFLGPSRLPLALFAMAMVGGLMAVVEIMRHGSVQEVAANIKTLFVSFGRRSFSGWKGEAESEAPLTIHSAGALTVPYGVAISAGALIGWFMA